MMQNHPPVLGAPNSCVLSVIIVNWNTRERVLACLDALAEAVAALPHEIVVVDNASRDGSAATIAARHPRVHLIRNIKNRGFAGGVNDGLAMAGGSHILVLNPDIVVDQEALQCILGVLDAEPSVGAATPVFVTAGGVDQRGYVRREPSLMQVLLFDTQLESLSRKSPRLVGHYLEDRRRSEGPVQEIEQIPGAFVCTRRDVIERVGGMDERFPLFYEDVDWSVRMRAAGFRLVRVGTAKAVHAGGASFSVGNGDWILARYRGSQVLYFGKHAPWSVAFLVRCMHIVDSTIVVVRKSVEALFLHGVERERALATRRQHATLLRLMLLGERDSRRGLPA